VGGVECTLVVSDDGLAVCVPVDGDDVETASVAEEVPSLQPGEGELSEFDLLVTIDSFRGGAVALVASGFHFDEHDRVAIEGDQVDLAELAAGLPGEDAIAKLFEMAGGDPLTFVAQ